MNKPAPASSRRLSALMLIAAAAALLAPACAPSEEDIKQQIEAARPCKAAEECIDVGSVCPFGCAIVVNKSQADQIRKLVQEHQNNTCVYDCIAVTGVTCEANRCTAKTQ